MANPVGTPQKLQAVDDYVSGKIKEWLDGVAQHPTHWWEFWKQDASTYKAAQFVIKTVDDLVLLVQEQIPVGADKKATVLIALGTIYDFVVTSSLPLWLKPFSKQVRLLLINVVMSEMIDFLVNKYKTGSWGTSKSFAAPQA